MPLSRPARRALLRGLFLTHRWVGIATCVLFAMWFASGLVMLYVPYPALSPVQRWAGAAPIDWAKVDVPPPVAPGQAALLLEMRDGEPVWRIERGEGGIETRAARAQAVLPPVDARYARRVAMAFGHARALSAERLMRDQWTVAGGFDRHRPLWKIALDDSTATDIYISSATGLPVQRTTRSQRLWNWLGSVPHWIYPTILRQDNALWRQVVMWVAGPCIAVALTGLWIGILRARFGRRRYRGERVSPYRGWMFWHHISGLVGGVFLLTWIFSGWLSVDPGRLFAGGQTPPEALQRYRVLAAGSAVSLPRLAAEAQGARTVEIMSAAGRMRIVIDRASRQRRVLDGATMAVPRDDARPWARETAALVEGGRVWRIDRLTQPDAYWADKGALPLLRLRFDDPARSWLYVDPATGEVVARQDRSRRLYRLAFDLLHTWNWPWLIDRQPLRDGVIWVLSLVGLMLSASGIVIGYRRVRRTV